MKWPGTKNAAGVCERLISLIPPHRVYVAPFAGFCAVAARMRPAERRVFVDLDCEALEFWRRRDPAAELFRADSLRWLRGLFELDRFKQAPPPRPDVFLHVDPPYFPGTCQPRIYRHELTADQHAELLDTLRQIPAAVMLAGYRCQMYDRRLSDWRRVDYPVQTRGGTKVESVWMNYDPPAVLHDARFVGADKRERERIRRRQRNMLGLVARLPAVERQAMLQAIADQFGTGPTNAAPPEAAALCVAASR